MTLRKEDFFSIFDLQNSTTYNLLGYNDQQGGQVFRIQDKVLLLDQVSQVPGQQAATVTQ